MSDEYYRRGNHYEAQHKHFTTDVEFYRLIAREYGGPILELACGTGRILEPLSNDGHDAVGIDVEESMLEVAREKLSSSVELRLADVRNFHLDRTFQLVLIPFNSIGHLHERQDVEKCFRCVRDHLADSGLFVLSMFNPDLPLLTRSPDNIREISRYPDPESEHEVVVTESASYDRATQIMTSTWHYTVGEKAFENYLRLRIFFPQELDALLHYAGFEVRDKFGNFDRTPFSSESPQQIILARPSNNNAIRKS